MIILTAKIDLVSDNSIISYSDGLARKSNISSPLANVVNAKVATNHPFILGKSKFGDGSVLTNKINGYLADRLGGTYGSKLHFETAQPLQTIVLQFNPYYNATNTVIINGTTFSSDNNIMTVALPSATSSIDLELEEYTDVLYLEGIYTTVSIAIDESNLLSLDNPTMDRANYANISYGIISNSGSLSFIDLDGAIGTYIEAKLLKKGVPVTIELQDTLTKKKQSIGQRYTTNWGYDNADRVVRVQMQDSLIEWQDITVEGIDYDPRSAESHNWTLADYYNYLYNHTPSKYNMQSYAKLGESEKNVLQRVVPYGLLETGSLWAQWQKLCVVAQAHIFDENGTTVFRYNGGN